MRSQLTTDYGYDVTTMAGVRAFDRSTSPRLWAPKYANAGLYVAAVRRIGRRHASKDVHFGSADARCSWCRLPMAGAAVGVCACPRDDGRLLAMGWNRWSPRTFVQDGHIDRWLAYWRRCANRPETVGSSHNVDVDLAFGAFVRGVPAGICARLPVDVLRRLPPRLSRSEISRLVLAARCYSRRSAGGILISLKAAVALGRFSPEEQEVALAPLRKQCAEVIERSVSVDSVPPGYMYVIEGRNPRPVRIRDIDWVSVARLSTQLARDASGRLRAALAYHEYEDRNGDRRIGRRFASLVTAAGVHLADAARWLSPAYPRLEIGFSVRIARGETPVQLSGGQLSRREAHEWLLDGGTDPIDFICRKNGVPSMRSWLLARWVIGVQRDDARRESLYRERELRGPAGEMIVIRYIDRIDEILDEDLAAGRSVDAVFERAATRIGGAWLEKNRTDHRALATVPARFRPFRRCMRPLLTPAQLVREGDELHHCVGTYAPAVERGQSLIFAIDVCGKRSTLELRPDGHVMQHRGPRNAEPDQLCKKVVDRFLRRSGLAA